MEQYKPIWFVNEKEKVFLPPLSNVQSNFPIFSEMSCQFSLKLLPSSFYFFFLALLCFKLQALTRMSHRNHYKSLSRSDYICKKISCKMLELNMKRWKNSLENKFIYRTKSNEEILFAEERKENLFSILLVCHSRDYVCLISFHFLKLFQVYTVTRLLSFSRKMENRSKWDKGKWHRFPLHFQFVSMFDGTLSIRKLVS